MPPALMYYILQALADQSWRKSRAILAWPVGDGTIVMQWQGREYVITAERRAE